MELQPLVPRGDQRNRNGDDRNGDDAASLEAQLSDYHKRQRARRERQRGTRERSMGRAGVGLALAGATVLALLALVWSGMAANGAPPARLETIMSRVRHFSGVVRVSHNGHNKFEQTRGSANVEFARAMDADAVFPIGSNSKLFTSVALYQLQEAGKVELTTPVNLVLDQTDFAAFGFPNQTKWCPKLAGAGDADPCENITFVQLLQMGSGIGDELNCDNVGPEFCRRSPDNLALYRGSIAAHVGDFINDPLVFRPGTNYSYSNPNFVLLSYLVEKLSGQTFEAYLDEHIFKPLELNSTYYDPYSGQLGVHPGTVDQYVQYYYKVPANASASVNTSASGSEPSQAVETVTHAATGTCRPYMSSGAESGSGGLQSSSKDMHRWYKDLFHHRGTSSKVLNQSSIELILHRRNPSNPSYAQGVHVTFSEDDDQVSSAWPSEIAYCGGMKCATTCMAMAVPSFNESSIASAFSNNAHLVFASQDAFEAFHPTGMLTVDYGPVNDTVAVHLAQQLLDGYLRYRASTHS